MNKKSILFLGAALALGIVVYGVYQSGVAGQLKGAFPGGLPGIQVLQPTTQVNDQLVVADGSTEYLVGKFKVEASINDFEVQSLTIAAGTGVVDSIESVRIAYPTDLANPTVFDGYRQSYFTGNGFASFAGIGFMVPANNSVDFEIYITPAVHTDDGGSADSGDKIQISMAPKAIAINAIDLVTAQAYDGNDADVIPATVNTNKAFVFKTIPTVSVPVTAQAMTYGAQQEVFRFNLDANANGDLSLLGLRFDVASSGIITGAAGLGGSNTSTVRGKGNVPGRWEMFEVINNSIDYSTQVGSGEYIYNGHFNPFFSDEVYMDVYDNTDSWGAGNGAFEKVSAGGTRTYAVVTSVTDDGVDNINSISVRIGSDPSATNTVQLNPVVGRPITKVGMVSSAFIWSDRPNVAGFGTGAASLQVWNNAYKVPGLPTSYVTST